MIKRFFDIFFSAILLVLLFPIVLITSVLVFISFGRPVFFKQIRPGFKGQPFTMYKFRTMAVAFDNQGNLLPDSDRLTWFGNTLRSSSVDELPALINVFRGQMSLVGPRPLLMEYLPLYNEHQARRHLVKPGITGWAQVNGRNAISWSEKFDLDVWYVDNQSFTLDLIILFRTIHKVLLRDDITEQGKSTMSKFTGNFK